jgi:hypothetical protein
MTRSLSVSLLFLTMAVIIGCTGTKSPVAPSELNRTSEVFQPVQTIFGPNYHDINLGGITTGPQGLRAGIPTYVNGTENAAVAIQRVVVGQNTLFKPMYRWLGFGAPVSESLRVPAREISNWTSADYRWPKCDSLVFRAAGDSPFIELAVCYQVTGVDGADWDIGLTIMRWYYNNIPYDFPAGTPDYRVDGVFPEGSGGGLTELHPDLAYDPITGDLFVTYEDALTSDISSPVHIKCRKLARDPNNLEQFTNYNPGNLTYPLEYDEQGGHEHNGYTPCIDIGWVDFSGTPVEWVAIAYTSQYWVDN